MDLENFRQQNKWNFRSISRQERGNLPDNTAVLFKKRTLLPVLMTYENIDFTGYLYCFLRWQQRTLKNKIRKKIMY